MFFKSFSLFRTRSFPRCPEADLIADKAWNVLQLGRIEIYPAEQNNNQNWLVSHPK